MSDVRIERDSMGEMEVPGEAYYGASTQRAVLNFPISSLRIPTRMVRGLGWIKWAAAGVNQELGRITAEQADAIRTASREIVDGKLDGEFVVDVFQTGSGTSSNMNANEVIANRAAELLGAARGSRDAVHPNDHVNLGQSSNDVIPTALHVGALLAIAEVLEPGLKTLQASLERQSERLWNEIKTGRTHLQDATPIRFGQVFRGYAGQIERGLRRVEVARAELSEVALGGTAVGTGLNTHRDFATRVTAAISKATGLTVRETENHFQAQSTLDAIVTASGQLRTVAVSLMKIANDIRLLASGPRTGLGELTIPEVQPGSSIMPGKVNPVIAESAIMVGAQVIGNDAAITQSAEWSQFELNTMLPVAGHNLIESIEILGAAAGNFATRCIDGVEVTPRGAATVEQGLSIVTGLVPLIGYDLSAKIAKEAAASGRLVREVAAEMTDLTPEQLEAGLDATKMTAPDDD